MLLRSLVPLSLLVGLALAGGDDGPGDPDFAANDGDLDSAVNPQVRSQKKQLYLNVRTVSCKILSAK